jgi:hypothetical protein
VTPTRTHQDRPKAPDPSININLPLKSHTTRKSPPPPQTKNAGILRHLPGGHPELGPVLLQAPRRHAARPARPRGHREPRHLGAGLRAAQRGDGGVGGSERGVSGEQRCCQGGGCGRGGWGRWRRWWWG